MHDHFGSYCDEFGHQKDPNKKYFGIAGLLAWSDDWQDLSGEWEECLSREEIPRPFHMTDFVHHCEGFDDPRWQDSTERRRVLGLLLGIIEKFNVVPVGAAVVLHDYNRLTGEQKDACKDPYYLAFQAVTSNMALAAARMDFAVKKTTAREAMETGEPASKSDFISRYSTSMVYAKLRKFTGPAEGLWGAMKRYNMVGAWMGSYTPADPIEYPPLQVADIWAYSLGHVLEHKRAKATEAKSALRIFLTLAERAALGLQLFTILDRRQILTNIGKIDEL